MQVRMLNVALLVGVAGMFAACSSGSDGGGGTSPAATPLSGVFIDSPVGGLGFTCAPSGSLGTTNGNGQYTCLSTDTTVSFSLYGRPIGAAVPPAPVVTALSVLNSTSLTDPQVVNLSQLLLTLAGGPPAPGNPIVLPATPPANFPATIDYASAGFDTSFPGLTLVSEGTATTHLQDSFKTLSVTVVNSGAVTSTPAGITCAVGTCSAVFQTGTVVTLTATGTGFIGWSNGTGSANCSGAGTCVVTLNADSTVTATFPVAPPPATLTILPNGGTGAGAVTCSANGGAFGPCAASYPNPTALVIRATANSGSTFTGWSDGTGNATSCNNTAIDCSINLTANSVIRANFTLPVLNSVTAATTTANGGGGTVTCTANGGAAGPCGSYPVGTIIVMTATPDGVSTFTGWSNGSGNANVVACNGVTTPCQFTLTANSSITANFNRPILSVTISGTGSVSSNPAGISNCVTNCTAPFDRGTSVTLTASGGNFTGWSGGCSGTGSCVVTVSANTSVTATFSQTAALGRYVFMRDFATFPVSTVKAIDPANAGATPPIVSSTALAPIVILTSGWDGATATYANTTATSLMYASGGKLWRVQAAKSSGVPGTASNPPVQVSSEAGATNVCGTEQIERATTGTTKLVYVLAGPDNDCAIPNDADNVTKIVSVLDSATTPPTTLPAGLVYVGPGHGPGYVVDMSTGNATGIFLLDVVNALTLKFMNLNTGVIATIQANMGHVFALAQDTSDRVFLLGGPNHNQLYIYTVSTNSLILLVNGASELVTGRPLSDRTNLYLAEQATGKLYQVPQNATGPSNVVTLLAGVGFPIRDPFQQSVGVYVTTNHVFLQTYVPCSGACTPPNLDADSSGLYRVPKAGGAATPIVTHAAGAGIFDVRSVSNLVYYNHKRSPTVPAASAIREDGTSIFTTSATICPGGCGHWSADVERSYSFRTGGLELSKRVLLVFAGPTQNGGTLFAFDALTGIQGANLGVVPATNPAVTALFGSSFIDSTLLMTGVQNGTGNNLLFFADTLVPGSLTQVPTLPAGSWHEVDIFGF
jgi:hypothetical protein